MQVESLQDQLILKLSESTGLVMSLKKKIIREAQKYSNLIEEYRQLQSYHQPVKDHPELTLDTRLNKDSESQLHVFNEEMQSELTKLQSKIEYVNNSLEKVEVIMNHWNETVS